MEKEPDFVSMKKLITLEIQGLATDIFLQPSQIYYQSDNTLMWTYWRIIMNKYTFTNKNNP